MHESILKMLFEVLNLSKLPKSVFDQCLICVLLKVCTFNSKK